MYKKILALTILLVMGCIYIVIYGFTSEAASEGWRQSNGGWWYEFSDGSYAMSEYIEGFWVDSDGWYDSAWNGSWYCNSTGWWFQSGSWYPVNEWLKIDKQWYHFNSLGYMDTECWIGDYYVGSSGAWIPNMAKEKASNNMVMDIGDERVSVSWEDNESVKELKELASSGLSVSMSMYGGFEQVGSLGQSITRNDKQITTEAGDIVLYSGNQLVVFYGSNSWSYTRLGKINLSQDELKDLLSNGDVRITLSLE